MGWRFLGTERECQNRQAVRSRICALITQKSAYTLILGELHSRMAPQAICVRAVRAAANYWACAFLHEPREERRAEAFESSIAGRATYRVARV